MMVHRDAAVRTRRRTRPDSGRVTVTVVAPAVMALARILATGDRRVIVQRDGSVIVANGAR